MPIFQADTSNFAEFLEIVRDDSEICLASGDYKGTFTINKAIKIRGNGDNTIIFAVDEPALIIKVPGVHLENLALERTVGGDTGAVVLQAENGTNPILNQVRLRGTAPNVQWQGVSWDIPAVVEFGEIQINRQVTRTEQLQLGESCQVDCEHSWLQMQPNYLSPGLQKLDIIVNSQDIPAGTILSGAIVLKTLDRNRKIKITASIIPNFSISSSMEKEDIKEGEKIETSEVWGYRFTGGAVDNLIRDIEGKAALDKYADFTDKRNRAEDLLSDILGDEPRLFYVRRQGPGQETGEEKWELTLATDDANFPCPEMLETQGKTLNLLAIVTADGYGGLRLISARLFAKERGQINGFSIPYIIRLSPNFNYRGNVKIPRSVMERMAIVPFCGDHVPTEEQLKAWKAFLNIQERIAKTRQFCVPFFGHNYGSATRRITFEIDATKSKIDKSSPEFLSRKDFWKRAAQARNEDLKLWEIPPEETEQESIIDKKNTPVKKPVVLLKSMILLGSIEEVDQEKGFIRVRLDSDLVNKIAEDHYQLPKNGFLSFEAAGDLTQIKRQKKALDDLQRGDTQNPYLSQFFFDAAKARLLQQNIKLKPEDLLLSNANPDQIAAVETVLSAQDMVLIQGPPGTGKTTVIAEICYQVALRGGKTLIASQANLAVDNALSRLIHNPVIRALRKGRAERVEEEGLPFLEEKVIGTWLQNTADDCQKNLDKRRENIKFFRELLVSSEKFTGYLAKEERLAGSEQELKASLVSLKANSKIQENKQAENQLHQRQIVEYFIPELDKLLAMSTVNWEEPAVINLLQRLTAYKEQYSYVSSAIEKIQVAVKEATQLGINIPNLPPFVVVIWLRNKITTYMSGFQQVLTTAHQAIAALEETEKAVQISKRNSAAVENQQREYQQIIDNQKTMKQAINSLQIRKSNIEAVRSEINKWLNQARLAVIAEFKICLQQRIPLQDEKIILPSTIVGFVNVKPAVWKPSIDRCKSKISNLINKQSKESNNNNFESNLSLSNIAKELIDGIVDSARKWLNQQEEIEPKQIKLVLAQLEKWQVSVLTFKSAYEALYNCVKEGKRFTDNLIQLPPELLAIAPAKFQPWRSNFDRCRSKIANLIKFQSEQKEISPVNAELERIAAELINGIVENGSQWLNKQEELDPTQAKLVLAQLKKWQVNVLTVKSAYDALHNCVKENKRFTDNSIQLPPELLAIAPAKFQPWRSNFDRCRSKIANLIKFQSEQKEISPVDAELDSIAAELINGIVDNVSQWLNKQEIESNREIERLQQQLKQQQHESVNLNMQLIEKQIAKFRSDVVAKKIEAMALLREVADLPEVPYELSSYVCNYLPILSRSDFIAVQQFSMRVSKLESRYNFQLDRIKNLKKLIYSLDPLDIILSVKNSFINYLSLIQESSEKELAEYQRKIREIEVQLQQLQQKQIPAGLIAQRKWWESAYLAIPDHLKPPILNNNLFDLDFLHNIKAQFDAWQQELNQEESYLKRYEQIVTDWITTLRHPSAQDQSDLKRIYMDNANVIGITCSQAAGFDFAKEFNYFDVVIIDEVSKCTPPELLIPALKAKKLVLIGDYRQLPPMLHENSLEDIAQEIGSMPEDVNFLQESLFKKQFESAQESIKRRLTIQYRMHPYIMGAINQFYDHRLKCGILEPEQQRAHNLTGEIIKANHHLLWVKMPQNDHFKEDKEGTSSFNLKEVEAIDIICQQMEDTWNLKVAEGKPKKEIGIITFYGAQLRLIEEMLSNRKFPSLQIRTGTVDRFQGMERAVVIVSMVRNNPEGNVGFANKPERVNVAFSRAQELLVIVGCYSLFTQHRGKVGSMYSEVANVVRRNGGLIDVSSILSS